MNEYTFYVDGANLELVVFAESEKQAHRLAWESLNDEQQNATRCLDLIDVREVTA